MRAQSFSNINSIVKLYGFSSLSSFGMLTSKLTDLVQPEGIQGGSESLIVLNLNVVELNAGTGEIGC
jgi:hypothetical protein